MKILKLQFIFILLMISVNSQSQWVRTNGPNGGYVDDFAVNGNTVFAATIGGIYRSDDSGLSWISVSNFGATTICITGSTVFASGEFSDIYRSTDNGNSWVNISFLGATDIYVHNGILFTGTGGAGVYRSTNNGNSFQAVNNGFLGSSTFIRTFASSGNLLYTGVAGNGGTVGVYVSSNNGDVWTQMINGLPLYPSTSNLAVSGTDVYAAVYNKGIYKTTNSGGNWFAVNTGLPLSVNEIAVQGGIIYAGMNSGIGAYKSTNNGDSWVQINNGLPVTPTTFALLATENYVLLGSQYAVYRTTNSGSSWFSSYKGIANTIVNDLVVNGNIIYAGTKPGAAGGGEGVSVTSDGGNTWSPANGDFFGNVTVNTIAFNGTTMFAGTIWGIYRSTNSGANWINVSSTGHGAGVEKIIILNNIIFAATYGRGVKKSTDNGTTWEFSNNGLGNDRTVNTLMVDGNNLYAGVFVGIYLSTDYGANWVEKNNGIYPGTSVYSLVRSGNNLLAGSYVGSSNGFYLSTDNAASWNIVPAAPPKIVYDFVTSATQVFAASDSGVYKSTNYGTSWTKINSGLTPGTQAMSITLHENFLYIGTYEKGVWKYPLSSHLTLDLIALIQGFYDPVANLMINDTARIYLRNVSPPYSLVDSAKSFLDANGSANSIFTNAINSVPYYIVIKHRNGLETWSASGQTFTSGNLSYDFTLSSSMAYGDNQVSKGSEYCIYNGDVNQDGAIDVSDLGLIDNDVFNFNSGYIAADVNGDGFVDLADLEIADNNVLNFIVLQRP
ncbi:MAG: hypothetical protein M3R36_11860 [Bacteroidota bacterium]|nr:hypothetical protein [Bacteroidota bacterium]